jgi:hypothetical protein
MTDKVLDLRRKLRTIQEYSDSVLEDFANAIKDCRTITTQPVGYFVMLFDRHGGYSTARLMSLPEDLLAEHETPEKYIINCLQQEISDDA